MIPKTNKTIQAKAKAAKADTDYVISEALCDFRSLCDFWRLSIFS